MKKMKKMAALLLTFSIALAPCAAYTQAETVSVSSSYSSEQKLARKNKWVTKSGKTYYYNSNGKKVKGVVEIDGLLYAFDSKGVLQKKKQIFAWKKKYYKVDKDGVAVRWTGAAHHAAKVLEAYCQDAKPGNRLLKAFEFARDLEAAAVAAPTDTQKADEYYGKQGLIRRKGDCATQAATFYWLATVLGYKAKVINAYVYNETNKTYDEHTWVEITRGKKVEVCDPNFAKEYAGKAQNNRRYPLGFLFKYGATLDSEKTQSLPYYRTADANGKIEKNGKA